MNIRKETMKKDELLEIKLGDGKHRFTPCVTKKDKDYSALMISYIGVVGDMTKHLEIDENLGYIGEDGFFVFNSPKVRLLFGSIESVDSLIRALNDVKENFKEIK